MALRPLSILGPPPIQTIPQGLLGLLQLKEMGRNPATLSDVVTPQVDLFPLWIQRQQVTLVQPNTDTLTLATGATGAQNFATKVPQGQAWYVTYMAVDGSSNTAADFIRYAPSVQFAGNGFSFTVGPDVSDAITARQRRIRSFCGPFWAPPGTQFSVYVFDVLSTVGWGVFLTVEGVSVPV